MPPKKGFPKAPTAADLNIADDWGYSADPYDYEEGPYGEELEEKIKLEKLKAEVAEKQKILAEKKKIAEDYLAQEAAKNANKKPLNSLLTVKTYDSEQYYGGSILKKATSVKGSSHDKTGAYGGLSSYTDADVVQAREYMQKVLGITDMSVNGRALEHILAEVYGFSKNDSTKEILQLKSKLHSQYNLELNLKASTETITGLEKRIKELQKKLDEAAKHVEVAKKIDKEKVAATNTGRRIKE